MTISEIVMSSITLFFIFFMVLIACGLAKYAIDRIEERKLKELELRKTDMYSYIDPIKLDNILNEWIHNYVQKYILNNITIHNIEFINQDMTKRMIKDVTNQIILEMSDMYVSYLKLKYNMNKQDDLIKYIYNMVMDDSLIAVSEYNRAE